MNASSTCLVGLICGAFVAGAPAATIDVAPIGGGVTLTSGDLSGIAFGGAEPGWSSSSLAAVSAALNAAGISTDGKVTFLAADTDHGLSLITLVDRQLAPQTPADTGHLRLDSAGDATSSVFMNDPDGTSDTTTTGPGFRVANADFVWNSNGAGVGVAWANLVDGNLMTYRFQAPATGLGLDTTNTFQYVTWNGNGWALLPVSGAAASFTETGEYGLAAVVHVVPAPAGLALAGLASLALGRRRR